MSFIALADCNNFFVSCERVFNPRLSGKPVVVLSSNDGCMIARSQEAKALGVPMGAPYFQWKELLRAHDVTVLSSNFPLYGDMSQRVMNTLSHFNPDLEIYSIDEAFLHLENIKDPTAFCRHLRAKVLQWTGIPISIGIATTKTLAKVANAEAKRSSTLKGIYHPTHEQLQFLLKTLPVKSVWGIGSRTSLHLMKQGVYTVAELCVKDDLWIQKQLSVTGLRTVLELRGIPCLSLEEAPAPKQSIMTSRSFGNPVFTKEELQEAVATFAARGAEKLREERSLAGWLQVFIMTSAHSEKEYYANQASRVLRVPTDYTPTLLEHVTALINVLFRPGFAYKRAGILLGGLAPKGSYQPDLFIQRDPVLEKKHEKVMELLDWANDRYGYPILNYAAQGTVHSWKTKRSFTTPCFTTRWEDLLSVYI